MFLRKKFLNRLHSSIYSAVNFPALGHFSTVITHIHILFTMLFLQHPLQALSLFLIFIPLPRRVSAPAGETLRLQRRQRRPINELIGVKQRQKTVGDEDKVESVLQIFFILPFYRLLLLRGRDAYLKRITLLKSQQGKSGPWSSAQIQRLISLAGPNLLPDTRRWKVCCCCCCFIFIFYFFPLSIAAKTTIPQGHAALSPDEK